ncbi:MAG: hypothetical protein EON59_12830 [Alphaproteobacteria bacterium]|nr:MAG: hypothetical protein EON59_12830 [Alphaproteobacteria bacterium]
MADIKDVTAVIASALEEVSVTGTLDVSMEGGETVQSVGLATGDDVEVIVTVGPIERAAVVTRVSDR